MFVKVCLIHYFRWLNFVSKSRSKCLYLTYQGAPETIQDRLVDVPAAYIETYKRYTRQGSRVLALAFKRLPDMTVVTHALTHNLLAS